MTTLPFEQQSISLYASGVINSDIPTDPIDGAFLDFLAVIDDCQTIRFKRGWYQPGEFELTINKNTNYAALFQRKRIIQIGSDVYKCGVIESVESKEGPQGALSETITVKGRELTSFLDRRIVAPPSGQSYYSLPSTTPVETVIKTIVNISIGPGASTNRKVLTMSIETDTAGGIGYVLSARYDNLLTLVSNACLATNSGVFVYLDHANKKWVLGWSLGVNRTAGQSINSRAVFSTDRETILTATLKDVDTGFKNFAVVGGQGDGVSRTIVTVPAVEPTGIDRREMFVDARDLTLTASLQDRGLQKLAENQFVRFLSGDVLAYSQLIYGQSYNIGDQVTMEQFGLTQNAYITTAEEAWSHGTYNLAIGFDRSSPTLPSQVSGALAQISKTMNATEIGTPIQPLVAAISANTTYTLENKVGMKIILIPAAYLKAASGGPFTLTLTTGTGTVVTVPIGASTDTILSGDMLFDIWIDASGNVTQKQGTLLRSNSFGYCLDFNDGNKTRIQWAPLDTSLSSCAVGETFFQFTFPFAFASVGTFYAMARPQAAWTGVSISSFLNSTGGSQTTSGFLRITTGVLQNFLDKMWYAIGVRP